MAYFPPERYESVGVCRARSPPPRGVGEVWSSRRLPGVGEVWRLTHKLSRVRHLRREVAKSGVRDVRQELVKSGVRHLRRKVAKSGSATSASSWWYILVSACAPCIPGVTQRLCCRDIIEVIVSTFLPKFDVCMDMPFGTLGCMLVCCVENFISRCVVDSKSFA